MPQRHRPLRLKLLIVLLGNAFLQHTASATEGAFELGAIQVSARKTQLGELGEPQVSSLITQEEMQRFNRNDVGEAVNLLSGVSIAFSGARNEKTINIRGFDSRQTPLFIDGIPVYVPYDGNVDISRFTTADLAAIQVAKGFSSVSYGPNTMGGAINLISRKPRKSLEGDVKFGFADGKKRQTSVNVGSNQGMWYAQAGASYLESDYFRMSSDYKATARENGGHRDNAYREDRKFSLKLGLTPNASDEYAISYYKQQGEKGQPPSTDPSVSRFWQWPYWDKESLYFVSRTALGEHEALKVRLFQDEFDNELNMFTNGSYSTLTNPLSGVSIYHDKTYGGSLELSSTRLKDNELKLVTHYKVDKHEGSNAVGTVDEDFRDTLVSMAVENNHWLASDLMLSLGIAHHSLNADKLYKSGTSLSKPDKMSATNGQAGIYYDFRDNVRFYASVAQKTRLPTLKDRFSLRFTTYIENPNLQPEESLNYEIGYQGSPWHGAKAEAAIFHNKIKDKIQTFYRPGSSSCTASSRCQMQNVGEARATGLELGLQTPVLGWLDIGGNVTWTDMKNVSDPDTRLTDIPRQKIAAYAVVRPLARLEIIPFIESESHRWASNTVRIGRHTTLNLKAAYHPTKALTLEAGVNNVGDSNYALSNGFPNPGRTWFTNVSYRF
ncbi:TonB-dependent siderophore receptor [Azonexus sp.]|uniref:TonB-dependent receptor plug domain-containing protein n=1 Tax=Azonexus sp. TaxID=1872668 RepID=UPI0027B97E5F|nr:TonB-dependent receptor [Azonexus sp.]